MNYDIKYKPSKCHNVCVWTFLPEPLRKINVQHYQDKILVRDLLTAVAQTLGIFKENIQYFAIFEGSLLNPSEKLDESDILDLPCKKLHSMQKWSFDIYGEKRALKTDMAALKLVRWQALSDIQEGRLKPSPDQIEKLDEVGSFVVENQLMSIIYSVQDYGAVIIEHCQVISELTIPQLCLARREYVKIQLDLKGLTLVTGNAVCVIPWVKIHMVTSRENMVEFEVYVQSQLIKWFRISTYQADYLKKVTSEIWKIINERHQTQGVGKSDKKSNNYPVSKPSYNFSSFDKI